MAEKDEQSWIFSEDGDTPSVSKIRKNLFERQAEASQSLVEQLEKAGSPDEVLQKLIDAKLEDVAAMTNSYKENLATVLGGIVNNTSLIGKEFDALRKFNEQEQGLKDEATRIVKEANQALEDAKTWGDWTNLFFGAKDRAIKNRTKALEESKVRAQELDTKAAMLFDERLRNANIEDQLDQFRHMTNIAMQNLDRVATANQEEYELTKVRHEKAIEIAQRAAKEVEKLNEKFKQAEEKLKAEIAALENHVTSTPEYAQQRQVIDSAQQNYDSIKMELSKMQAAYNSKEKFAAIEQTNMTALKVSETNIRALAIKLRSDNEERERTYAATIQLIKASNSQQSASAIDKVGDEADQKNLEIATFVAVASDKDAMERLYNHPKNMQRALLVIEAFGKMVEKNKQQFDNYREMIKKGYENFDSTGNGGEQKTEKPAKKDEVTTEEVLNL